jgi:hypothetical protein
MKKPDQGMLVKRVGLIVTMLMLVGLVVVIWPGGGHFGDGTGKGGEEGRQDLSDAGVEVNDHDTAGGRVRRDRSDEPKPWRADPAVIAMYAEADRKDAANSELEIFFRSQGITNYLDLMADALSGDAEALHGVFALPATDGAASESFAIGLQRLLEQLGDRYFAHHLGRQDPKVQRRIIKMIWRDVFDQIAAGQVPVLGNQTCEATGRLAVRLREAEQAGDAQ